MEIQSLFKPLAVFERKVAELYEWYNELIEGDAEAGFAFYQLAAEEHAYVKIIEYQRRLVRDSRKEFADISFELKTIEDALATVAKLRSASQPLSLDEALRNALMLETSAAEYLYKNAMKQANEGAARLLQALGLADRNHLGRLAAFAERRGVEPPPSA